MIDPLWFPFAVARPDARGRIVCLPCAGAGASMYREWGDLLPGREVLALQLPGREHRIREAPLTDLDDVVARVDAAITALPPGPPLVLFGHSLGAMVAFALARRRCGRGEPPSLMIAAGARAPHRPPRRVLHDLPLPVLLEEVVRLGGTSPRVVAVPELVALIEPALRADLALAECNVLARAPALPVPLRVLAGTEDVHIAASDVEAWREVAGARVDVEFVRGGHFFVRDAAREVADRVAAACDAARA